MQSLLISPKRLMVPPLVDPDRIMNVNDLDRDDEFLDHGFRTLANVCESEVAYVLEVLAPGFEKDEISVDLDSPGILTVNGIMKNREDFSCYRRHEFSVRNFSRSFLLPDNILLKEICAGYLNGVVTVIIPKRAVMKTSVTIIIQ